MVLVDYQFFLIILFLINLIWKLKKWHSDNLFFGLRLVIWFILLSSLEYIFSKYRMRQVAVYWGGCNRGSDSCRITSNRIGIVGSSSNRVLCKDGNRKKSLNMWSAYQISYELNLLGLVTWEFDELPSGQRVVDTCFGALEEVELELGMVRVGRSNTCCPGNPIRYADVVGALH